MRIPAICSSVVEVVAASDFLPRPRERELGIRIPAAVAEWYAIDGAVEHFVQGSGPIIVRLEQLGLAAGGRDLAAGRLLLASDYQGCCDWVVDLAPAFPAEWNVPLPGMESLAQDQAAVAACGDPPFSLLGVPPASDETGADAFTISSVRITNEEVIKMPGHAVYPRGWEDHLEDPGKQMSLPSSIPSSPRRVAWLATHERLPVPAKIRQGRPGLTSIDDKRSV